MSPLDLHVLGTPPAFVLSQDQTLVFNPSCLRLRPPSRSPRLQHSTLRNLRCLSPLPPLPFRLLPLGSRLPFRFLRGVFLLARFSLLYRFQGSVRSLPQAPFRTPSRASLDRIPNFFLPVNPFFEKFFIFSELFSRPPHLVNFFLLYIYILWTFSYDTDTIFSGNLSSGGS